MTSYTVHRTLPDFARTVEDSGVDVLLIAFDDKRTKT
jgi:hypothetical protein